jgi:hypothetical protein
MCRFFPLLSAPFGSQMAHTLAHRNSFFMTINVTQRQTRDGKKIFYTLEWGKGPGERKATGIFIYARPKDQTQKNHNKEAMAVLEKKQSQLIIERQSIGSAHIPQHAFKANFLDYYEEYAKNNTPDPFLTNAVILPALL